MDIITAVLEIDRHAKEKIEKAYDEKKRIAVETEAEKEKIRSELSERAENRIKEVEMVEKGLAGEKLDEIRAQKEKSISELDRSYNENHEKWENDIYNAIVG